MLLRSEDVDGVEVVSVVGSVRTSEAATLERCVRAAVDRGPRGVLLDLSRAEELAPEAVDALNWLTATASGWPRPALTMCCAPEPLRELLVPAVTVHGDRATALQHVDDRDDTTVLLEIELPCDERAPGTARRAVRDCAQQHGLPADDLALVVSELVTNAVRYGRPPVRLELDSCPHCVTVVVADAGDARPSPRQTAAEEDAEGGRGLLLVDLLAHDTGVRAAPPGKAVWAELSL